MKNWAGITLRKRKCIKCGRLFYPVQKGEVICDNCEFYNWLAEEDKKKKKLMKRVI